MEPESSKLAQTDSIEFEKTLRNAFAKDPEKYHLLVEARAKLCFDYHFQHKRSDDFFSETSVYREVRDNGSVSMDSVRTAGCQVLFSRRTSSEMIVWRENGSYCGFASHFNAIESYTAFSSRRAFDL
jgi:hypothetical protein